MKHINPSRSSVIIRVLFSFFTLVAFAASSYGQCSPPFAKGDFDSTLRNVPVDIHVVSNDLTFNGSGVPLTNQDTLYIKISPKHGQIVVLNDSIVRYIPDLGFVGTDNFVYTVCNPCGCASAFVAVNVKPFCPAPRAADDYFGAYNNITTTLDVTANDTNIASGPLNVTILKAPIHGTTSINKGKVNYQGNSGYIGPDTFGYIVCDTCFGGSCDTAFVYLNVITCAPVVAMDDTLSLMQGDTMTRNVALNDTNYTGFGNTTVVLLGGSKFGSSIANNNGVVTYIGGILGFGIDSIPYQICTDCGCDTAYFMVNMAKKPCSKPKVFADNVYAGYSILCSSTFNVLSNDKIPVNSGTVTVAVIAGPIFGTATVVNNKIIYTCGDSTRVGTADQVRYSLCNDCFCDTGLVNINITNYPCNGLNPVVNKDTAYVCRNYGVKINVTANDYDPEGTRVAVSDSSNGVIGQANHGKAAKLDSNTIIYTADTNYIGPDFFTYIACDHGNPSLCNIARVDVFVEACAHPPVITNSIGVATDTLYVTVQEDSNLIYCLNYRYVDSPQVRIAAAIANRDTIAPNGVSANWGTNPCVKITLPKNSRKQDIAQVIICNEYPLCDTVYLVIKVAPINHPPFANNDTLNYTWEGCKNVNVIRNDGDIDPNDHLTISGFDTTTLHGGKVSYSPDSSLCYTPDSSFTGIDSFMYMVCDTSKACVMAWVYVRVPVRARNDEYLVKQGMVDTLSIHTNDTKTASDSIQIGCQPLHGTVQVSGTNVIYTPNPNYPYYALDSNLIGAGRDSFCYVLCANGQCDTARVYVTILPRPQFEIFQGFSPNGDGTNDKFEIPSADLFPQSQLLVFNRYGTEVWRNDNPGYFGNEFDGKTKGGDNLPDGSYWYIFKFNQDNVADRSGYIVIVR